MFFQRKMVSCSQSPFLYDQAPSVADPADVGGLTPPPSEVFFFACHYMKIPVGSMVRLVVGQISVKIRSGVSSQV